MTSTEKNVAEYVKSLNNEYESGIATEHSYRPALKALLEGFLPGYRIVNEPKRAEYGAPDLPILDANGVQQAFVEAKDLNDPDLDGMNPKRNKEQFDRYRAAFPNVMFTDYLDFHLYLNGEFVDSVRIAEIKGGKIVSTGMAHKFEALIARLIPSTSVKLASAEKLASLMAARAKMLADALFGVLNCADGSDGGKYLNGYFEEFKKILIPELMPREFADIYAQTIAYGMFAARLGNASSADFSKERAAKLIPKTNPFLRKLFQIISGGDVDARYEWIIDSIAQIFLSADIETIMRVYHGQGFHDPLMHFYEDFLSAYDKKTKKQKGVWYTPSAVVSFIVRSIDEILVKDFGLPRGLADDSLTQDETLHRVQILDPATGTGTFLAEIIRQIHDKFEDNQGLWPSYVKESLVPRLIGFEVLMAPYVIAHMKMNLTLEATGLTSDDLSEIKRFNIFLTNSLEEEIKAKGNPLGFGLTDESEQANSIKGDRPIMVMLGNPPYNAGSGNKGKWILGLLDDYKKEPGGDDPLSETYIRWLGDDYVKFIRLAQDYIERTGSGIVAFINPHAYIDAPSFRGMRWRLLKAFDKIYCLNLHGNARLKEKTPNGEADDNVFDIQQGVCINIFVKTGRSSEVSQAEVYYADLWGGSEKKYDHLLSHTVHNVRWKKIKPSPKIRYRFDTDNTTLITAWSKMIGLTDAFVKNNVGLVTARDAIALQDSRAAIEAVVKDFYSRSVSELDDKYQGKSTDTWDTSRAKHNVTVLGIRDRYFITCLVRPFDEKWTYYTNVSNGFIGRPCFEINKHLLYENISLIAGRIGSAANRYIWSAVFASDKPTENNLIRRSGSYIFPLFLYKNGDTPDDSPDYFPEPRRANLDAEMMKKFGAPAGLEYDPTTPDDPIGKTGDGGATFTPMDFWHYTYAVLHSNKYRTRFKQFLDADFPSVPIPRTREEFWALVPFGKKLKEYHLLRGAESYQTGVRFPKAGSGVIDRYKLKDGKIYINEEQYFDGVSEAVWNFFIGGYQPAQKWLKDRKGKKLSNHDFTHYMNMIFALGETIRLMEEIDGSIDL